MLMMNICRIRKREEPVIRRYVTTEEEENSPLEMLAVIRGLTKIDYRRTIR